MEEEAQGGEEDCGRVLRLDEVQSAEGGDAVASGHEVRREADMREARAGGDAESLARGILAAGGEHPGRPITFGVKVRRPSGQGKVQVSHRAEEGRAITGRVHDAAKEDGMESGSGFG